MKTGKWYDGSVFYDIESSEHVTVEELYAEYIAYRLKFRNDKEIDFDAYIENSLTINNGTLEQIF